jgi:hypothetical protein
LLLSCTHTGGVTEPTLDGLKQRAEQRWLYLIDSKFESAYQFETTAYRSVVSNKQFGREFGGIAEGWRSIEILDASVDESKADTGAVKLLLIYDFYFDGAEDPMQEGRSVFEEQWLFEDGEWRHLTK